MKLHTICAKKLYENNLETNTKIVPGGLNQYL